MKMYTSDSIRIREKNHFTVNVGAVLGQIATGGGGDHLAEQLTTMNILYQHYHHTHSWNLKEILDWSSKGLALKKC